MGIARWIRATAVSCVLGTGCTGGGGTLDAGPCDDQGAPAELILGATDDPFDVPTFRLIEDGDAMWTWLGPTGLWIASGAVRSRGIYPGDFDTGAFELRPSFVGRLTTATEQRISDIEILLFMQATDVGPEALDIYLVIDPDLEPAEFLGEPVTFEGVLTDVCNRQASSSVDVVLSCLPDDTYCAGL